MIILLAHNYYRQAGGEDSVFASEMELLQQYGHSIIKYVDFNEGVDGLNVPRQMVWSQETYRKLRGILREQKPEIAHFHNTFFAMSPSVYYACQDENIPVVQTLHNYRLLCPVALFYRDGQICEECLDKSLLSGIIHHCYHDSRLQTAAVANMLLIHRWMGTWKNKVDTFIALTQFARQKFIQGGIPPEKLTIKPNFVPDPGPGKHLGEYVLFVGRLSSEKGIKTLLEAWQQNKSVPLKIIGNGPLKGLVEQVASENSKIEYIGLQKRETIFKNMKDARFLIFPSECYEGFPMVLGEAFACKLPVVAANTGAASEIIKNQKNGLHFRTGDPNDLTAKVHWAWEHSDEMAQMGLNARHEYEQKYSPKKNYEMLIDIYQHTIENHKAIK